MSRTLRLKLFTATILVVVLIAPFIVASLPSARADAGAETTIYQTPQPRTVLRAFAPFWQIGNGYSSALIIRNTSQELSASATPIVFTTDATPIWLPSIQLAPGEVKRIYLEEALPAAGSAAETGRLLFRSMNHNHTPLSARW